MKDFFTNFKNGMKDFGLTINIIINTILLTIVYFIGVGFSSIAAAIFKKKFLDIEVSENIKSYWSDLNLRKESIEKYYRQFWGEKCIYWE